MKPSAQCGELKVWRCALLDGAGAILATTVTLDLTRSLHFPPLKQWAVAYTIDVAGSPVPLRHPCIIDTGQEVTAYIHEGIP